MDSKPRLSQVFYYISIIIVLITGCVLLMIRLNICHETSQYFDFQHSSSAQVRFQVQDIKMALEKAKGEKMVTRVKTSKNDERWFMIRMRGTKRRMLSGLGSSPPRCTDKCGRCSPCKPTRVMIPPGTPIPTEYYPEAWRCKCGNKLYMP